MVMLNAERLSSIKISDMSSVLILIPPSEGKNPSGHRKPLGTLEKNVQVIYDRLTAYQGDPA
jgi:hypothetical protein